MESFRDDTILKHAGCREEGIVAIHELSIFKIMVLYHESTVSTGRPIP